MTIKSLIRLSIRRTLGYDIRRMNEVGRDPYYDMRKLTESRPSLVIFDVGANYGQTIESFQSNFLRPKIHSFEPSRETFCELQRRYGGSPDVYLNNFALGAKPGVLEFIENTRPWLSSFLEPGADCWGEIKQRSQIEVRTIDGYCAQRGITIINILKSDTQGFDLEVIKGAERLLEQRRIQLIYMEITFSNMYKGLPRFDEIYGFLADRGFALVSFYDFEYQNGRVGWTDALFVNPKFALYAA